MELFEEMEKLGITPDRITFTGLVSATTAAGKWELAQSFIDMMQVSRSCNHFFSTFHTRDVIFPTENYNVEAPDSARMKLCAGKGVLHRDTRVH